MNLSFRNNYVILDDLCDQIFDYFELTICDLETKLDSKLYIKSLKNKLETFSDKHFKSALIDFNNEIQGLKDHFPNELFLLEKISNEIRDSFNSLLEKKFFDEQTLINLKNQLKDSLNRLK